MDEDRREGRGTLVRRGLWLGLLLAWTVALVLPAYAFPRTLTAAAPVGIPLGKVLHVSVYAVLAATAFGLRLRRGAWLVLGGLSLHACGTELAQSLVPTRGPSLADVGLDHLGLGLGVLLAWLGRAVDGGWARP